MSFLADRYQQFTDDTSQFDLFKNFMVSDYDIFKLLIFEPPITIMYSRKTAFLAWQD